MNPLLDIYPQLTTFMSERDLLLLHALSTCYMMGLIWFIQLVHYPLFAKVGEAAHREYHQAHVYWTTWAVGPPMLLEAATTAILFLKPDPNSNLYLYGAGLLLIIWCSTAFIQVPCHQRLSLGFDPAIHRRLVRSNWIRCIAWSLRSMIALFLLR
jgi:hypothetical protein